MGLRKTPFRFYAWLPFAALVVLFGFVPAIAQTVELPARDFRGAKDHPLVSRFAGAVIIAHQRSDYDELVLPLGKYLRFDKNVANRFGRIQRAEGAVTRIAYGVPRGKTTLEIFRNYQQALARAGFRTLFACEGGGCGGDPQSFVEAMNRGLLNSGAAYDHEFNWIISAIGGDIRHLTSVLRRPEGDVYVAVTATHSQRQPPGALVQIVETQPMQTDQVTVDAKAIGAALAADGKVALYGVTFKSDSATIEPDSQPTLDEMASFLKGNPQVNVHIVGHTDNTGSLEHNTALSQRRAEAVVMVLSTEYGIAEERLSAKGLASYAPVASNREEAGRAKNRRVEMVER